MSKPSPIFQTQTGEENGVLTSVKCMSQFSNNECRISLTANTKNPQNPTVPIPSLPYSTLRNTNTWNTERQVPSLRPSVCFSLGLLHVICVWPWDIGDGIYFHGCFHRMISEKITFWRVKRFQGGHLEGQSRDGAATQNSPGPGRLSLVDHTVLHASHSV